MKRYYLKPEVDVLYINTNENILIYNSEIEITSNIGSNESKIFDSEEDNSNLWEND